MPSCRAETARPRSARASTGRPPRPPSAAAGRRKAAAENATSPTVMSPRSCKPLPASSPAKRAPAAVVEASPPQGCTSSDSGDPKAAAASSPAASPQTIPGLEDSAQDGAQQTSQRGSPRHSSSAVASIPDNVASIATALQPLPAPPVDLRVSAGSERMRSMLLLLDRLEAEAAAQQPVPPRPAGSNALAKALASQPLSMQYRRSLDAAGPQPCSTATQEAAAAALNTVQPHCKQPGAGEGSNSSQLAQHNLNTAPGVAPQPAAPAAAASTRPVDVEEAVRDAASVAAGVRGKIQRLQQQVAEKDCQIAALQARTAALAAGQQQALAAVTEQCSAQLAAAKREHEAELERQLGACRQLAGEKEILAVKCKRLAEDLAGMQAECARQIQGLQEGLARELRKQKEMWMAAERTKREEWMAQKERSIREATVKGLEPEVQKLVALHRAEVKEAEQQWEAQAARHLQAVAAEHEEQMARLKAAAATEAASAAAAERASAQSKAEEASQRFEAELCALRLRLAAEHQVALERAEAGRREDRALHEERLHQLGREHEQRVSALRDDLEQDRAAAAAKHQRELAAAAQEAAVGQEAWRAAVSERAAREYEARESALRRKLAAERDEELRAVVARLEEEGLAREQELERRAAAAQVAAEAKVREELSRAQRAAERATERAGTAEARCERLEALLHTLQQEVAAKGAAIGRLEAASADLRKEAARERKQLTTALEEQQAAHAAAVAVLEQRAEVAEQCTAKAEGQLKEAAERRERELADLKARVSDALATRDATITALRRQLDDLHAAC